MPSARTRAAEPLTNVPAFEVYFINSDLGGWRRPKLVREGMTVQMFCEEQMGRGFDAEGYQIRVNREATEPDYELQPGDIVSCTPTKVEGAYNCAA